jgi:hypothetical protein
MPHYLIVDPNESDLKLATDAIHGLKYNTLVCKSADEALRHCRGSVKLPSGILQDPPRQQSLPGRGVVSQELAERVQGLHEHRTGVRLHRQAHGGHARARRRAEVGSALLAGFAVELPAPARPLTLPASGPPTRPPSGGSFFCILELWLEKRLRWLG